MSLIHDALKKVQGDEKPSLGNGLAAMQGALDEKKGISKRTLALAVVLFLALGFFAYTKFLKKGPASAPSAPPAAAPSPLEIGAGDVSLIKKRAVDAYNLNDYDAASAMLSTASELAPQDPEVWNNMGLVARKRGDVVKARELYQKAIELKPDYPECLNNLAVLEMQSGNMPKAKEMLDKALKLNPASPEANFHMALISEQTGDTKNAIEHYRRFIGVGLNLPASVTDAVKEHVVDIEGR